MPFKDELLVEAGQEPNMLTTKMETVCEQIFNHFDSLDSHTLELDEFKTFLIAGKFSLINDLDTIENYRTMILDHFNSNGKGITLHGFKEFVIKMIENSYRDTVETMKNLGYNGHLVNEKARNYTLSVNSRPLVGSEPV